MARLNLLLTSAPGTLNSSLLEASTLISNGLPDRDPLQEFPKEIFPYLDLYPYFKVFVFKGPRSSLKTNSLLVQ